MADKLIVAIFSNASAAYDAAGAIKELKDAGGTKFKLKSGMIATKDNRGVVSVLEAESHPFHGMKVGAVAGGLICLIGGAPLAAVGALLGASAGAIYDAATAVLKSGTVTSIKMAMHPGTTAVIVEADEASPNAVDDIVAKGGGRVFREDAKF